MSVYQCVPKVVSGEGSLLEIVKEMSRMKSNKALIVTDEGMVNAGLVRKLENVLRAENIPHVIFSDVKPDPKYQIATTTSEFAKSENVDCVIGLGGGSSLDIAKVVSVLLNNEDSIVDMFGIDLVKNAGVPLILVPTTAGTGSEVTPIAILTNEEAKLKAGIVSHYLLPDVAILDPSLTLGLPQPVTAATGFDALIHAMEAYTSKNASSITDMYAREAIFKIIHNIRTAFNDGQNIKARTEMLEGSLLAGLAFANAGVTAVHAFAYPIGAEFHIPHGIANTIMLPPVFKFNTHGNLTKFAELAKMLGEEVTNCTEIEAAAKTVEAIEKLAIDLKVPQHLADYGVTKKDVPALATAVLKVTRLLANNPREITYDIAEEIYTAAL